MKAIELRMEVDLSLLEDACAILDRSQRAAECFSELVREMGIEAFFTLAMKWDGRNCKAVLFPTARMTSVLIAAGAEC